MTNRKHKVKLMSYHCNITAIRQLKIATMLEHYVINNRGNLSYCLLHPWPKLCDLTSSPHDIYCNDTCQSISILFYLTNHHITHHCETNHSFMKALNNLQSLWIFWQLRRFVLCIGTAWGLIILFHECYMVFMPFVMQVKKINKKLCTNEDLWFHP